MCELQTNRLCQNRINHNKTAYIVNLSCGDKFVMWSNENCSTLQTWKKLSLLLMIKFLYLTSNFVMWCKIACHMEQCCSTWQANLVIFSKIAPHDKYPETFSNWYFLLDSINDVVHIEIQRRPGFAAQPGRILCHRLCCEGSHNLAGKISTTFDSKNLLSWS